MNNLVEDSFVSDEIVIGDGTTWRDQLEKVYKCEIQGQTNLRPDVMRLYDELKLSLGEFLVLSWFVHYRGFALDYDALEKETGLETDQVLTYQSSLRMRGLLVETDDVVDVDIDGLETFFQQPENRTKMEALSYNECLSRMRDKMRVIRMGVVDENSVPALIELVKMIPDSPLEKGLHALMKGKDWNRLALEAKAVLFMLIFQFMDRGTEPYDPAESSEEIMRGIRELVRFGMVEIVPESGDADNRSENYKDRCIISCRVAHTVFYGQEGLIDHSRLCHQAEYLKVTDIKPKQLFYNPEDVDQVNLLRSAFGLRRYAGIARRLRSRGRRCGMTCLLSGAPGVGKTELVRQLAKGTGRDIFFVDAARLNGGLWGDSERNVRELFMNFRYIYAISKKAPIMVLNEADGILGQRNEGKRAIERAESVVQTIFLQELERFEGLLVATTNLAHNLDPAFERRFLFRITVHEPEPAVMAKIWKTHIPELSDEQAEVLSTRYHFSGGHIENVAVKWDIHYSINGVFPVWEQLLVLCDAEVPSLQQSTRVHIQGF